MQQIRWGILSTAHINRRLIPPMRQSERSTVVVVGSRRLEQAREFAAKWDIPRIHGSYEALLADPEVDAVYIPLPNHLHCEWTVKAAEAGKHILCEKPLALSVAEVDRMVEAARRNDVVLLEAFQFRFHPQTAMVRRMIEAGELGEIHVIRSGFSFPIGDPNNIRLKPELGGGCLWDVGCYPISLMQGVLAENPVEVFGWQKVGPSGVDVVFGGQVRFASGAIGQFDSGFVSPYRVGAEIVGSEGLLYLPEAWRLGISGNSGMVRTDRQGNQTTIDVPDIDPFLCEVQALEARVLDGATPAMSLADSRDIVATITALYESARTGKPVKV